MQYETRGCHKYWEENSFSEGCKGGTHGNAFIDVHFSADGVDALVNKIVDFLGGDCDVELDACGEPGRIEVQMLETDDGTAPTERQIERWKAGELRLWLADYSFYVEAVERRTVELAPLVLKEIAAERGEV